MGIKINLYSRFELLSVPASAVCEDPNENQQNNQNQQQNHQGHEEGFRGHAHTDV